MNRIQRQSGHELFTGRKRRFPGRLSFVLILGLFVFAHSFSVVPPELPAQSAKLNVSEAEPDDTDSDGDIRIVSRSRTKERVRTFNNFPRVFGKRKVFSRDGIDGGPNADSTDDFPVEASHPRKGVKIETIPSSRGNQPGRIVSLGRKESAWGNFEPGSWCRTRTTATTFGGNKTMRSVTETKLTLVRIENDGIVLRREMTIKMGAVNHATPPEEIKFDFFGSQLLDGQSVTELQPGSVVIARKVIPCQLRQIEKTTERRHDSTILWYSPTVSPYLLQKETRSYDCGTPAEPRKTLVAFSQTTISKTSAHMLLGSAFSSYRSETVIQKGGCSSRTVTVHSLRIPGHTVKESTVEQDASGTTLYRSETVLLDYFSAKN